MQLRKNVDLGASFKRLVNVLDKTHELSKRGAEGKAHALGLLQGAVKLHISECEHIEGTPDEAETGQQGTDENSPDDLAPLSIFTRGI